MSGARRPILAATLGLAPQVLTETVYALAMRREKPFIPEEIHVITTSRGRERALSALLRGPRPRLRELARDYDLPGLAEALTPERIRVIADADGCPLADIGSEADNVAAADSVSALIRDLTADPETELHVSIAGGRKTMGFLIGYALSLYGRPQDRLSHVLVDAPLETHPEFFYPRPEPETLFDRDNRPFRADASRVALADIPFVRLREGLPEQLLGGEARYSEAVAAANERFRPPSLVVDLSEGAAVCHGRTVPLAGAELAFAAMLALRRKAGGGAEGALRWSDVQAAEFLTLYELTEAPSPRTIAALRREGVEESWFAGRVSRLNRALEDALGPLASIYTLKRFGRRPETRVGFDLPPEAITLRGPPWDGADAAPLRLSAR